MKYKCVKTQCPVCGNLSSCQLFLKKEGKVTYARVRHYKGKFTYCKVEDLKQRATLLIGQVILDQTLKILTSNS